MTTALRHVRIPPPRRTGGFTLIELIVTLTVLAVLVAVAVPSFGRFMASTRLSSQANEFLLALNLTRSEAVRRGQPVTLLATSGTAVFNSGYQIFTDLDGDGAIPTSPTAADGTVLRNERALPGSTTVTRVTRSGTAPSFTYTTATTSLTDRASITFNARGAKNSGAVAFFKICNSQYSNIPGRIIQVNLVGRVAVDSTTASCP